MRRLRVDRGWSRSVPNSGSNQSYLPTYVAKTRVWNTIFLHELITKAREVSRWSHPRPEASLFYGRWPAIILFECSMYLEISWITAIQPWMWAYVGHHINKKRYHFEEWLCLRRQISLSSPLDLTPDSLQPLELSWRADIWWQKILRWSPSHRPSRVIGESIILPHYIYTMASANSQHHQHLPTTVASIIPTSDQKHAAENQELSITQLWSRSDQILSQNTELIIHPHRIIYSQLRMSCWRLEVLILTSGPFTAQYPM